jgi:hypothetical protein
MTWIADHWSQLAALALAAAVLLVLCWALRGDDYRTRNDRATAHHITRHEDRPEPGQPGNDNHLLAACHAIYAATETARKEEDC